MNQQPCQPSFRLVDEIPDRIIDLFYLRIIIGIFLGIGLAHRILLLVDLPLLSIPEILWNCFVYLMPSRLVFALGKSWSSTAFHQTSNPVSSSSTQHAQKSEVLRNVLRLEKAPKLRRWSKSSAPPGLGNWDNSCYQNSVLQAFASLQSLEPFLNIETSSQVLTQDSTCASLLDLIVRLNSPTGSYLWTPPKLKSMSSWQQQDAQEYFSKVVDAVEKDLSRARILRVSANHQSGLSGLSGHPPPDQPESVDLNEHTYNLQRERLLMKGPQLEANPLEGLLAQRVGCTRCGYTEGLSLIPFNCLTLPLGQSKKYDIEDCLDEYTSLESIEGVECAKCTLLKNKLQLTQLSETMDLETHKQTKREESEILDDQAFQEKHYQQEIEARLTAMNEALRMEDFSETTLAKKCLIPSRLRTTSTKSKQSVIMRAPKVLVLHLNRSLFDESTGLQSKNYADVRYPKDLEISRWCIGTKLRVETSEEKSVTEEWEMSPLRSMIRGNDLFSRSTNLNYKLRAVITHYGRHENGHYICYRKVSHVSEAPEAVGSETSSSDRKMSENFEPWWQFSDEDVSSLDEESVLSQGGAFMLFYERTEKKVHKLSFAAHDKTEDHKFSALNEESGASTKPKHSEEAFAAHENISDHLKEPVDLAVSILPDGGEAENEDGTNLHHLTNISGDKDEEENMLSLSMEDQINVSTQDENPPESSRSFQGPTTLDIPAMRTAGPEIHRDSSNRSHFRSLHVVASM